jgi:2,4-dienoyl-CoA reductase-like NADH-dependent reductase (Old Yellow Enzyme family)
MRVVNTIRKVAGYDYPLLIKLGVQDTVEGGLTLEEGCEVAQKLASNGVDAIEISEGLEKVSANHMRKHIKPGEGEAVYSTWAKKVKRVIRVPIILVCGIRSFEIAEKMVDQNYADCISMCRPFIREPDLIHRWHIKDYRPATCISCNLCTERVRWEESLQCAQELRLIERHKLS